MLYVILTALVRLSQKYRLLMAQASDLQSILSYSILIAAFTLLLIGLITRSKRPFIYFVQPLTLASAVHVQFILCGSDRHGENELAYLLHQYLAVYLLPFLMGVSRGSSK